MWIAVIVVTGETDEFGRHPDAASSCYGYRWVQQQQQHVTWYNVRSHLIHREFQGRRPDAAWLQCVHAHALSALIAGGAVEEEGVEVEVVVAVAWGHMCVAFVVGGVDATFDYRIGIGVILAYALLPLADARDWCYLCLCWYLRL